MRSCINRVRKFFGKSEQQEQVEVMHMNNDIIVQHEKTYMNNNEQLLQLNDKTHKHNEVRYQSQNQDKAKEVATMSFQHEHAAAVAAGILTTSESHELLSKVDEPANAYIDEYKTFVEEKQQLLSASTPYTTAESFDFEQLFNQHSRRYSEVQALRLLRHAATDEHDYLAESGDMVSPLPSEQTVNPLRPVTLPRCYALPLELTEALRKLSDKSDSESEMRRALSQRQSKSLARHAKPSLERHSTEDENEVILRRPLPEQKQTQYGCKTCSLFERRQPDCPKLKLCLKTTSKNVSDAEVFTDSDKHSYEIPL